MKINLPFSYLFAFLFTIFSYACGFFTLPRTVAKTPLKWFNVLLPFFGYFFGMILVPLAIIYIPQSDFGESLAFLVSGLLPFIFVISYYGSLNKTLKKSIFWNLPTRPRKKIYSALLTTAVYSLWSLIILLPLIGILGDMIQKIMHTMFTKIDFREQHVITMFRRTTEAFRTSQTILTIIITTVLVIPFTEELLFRGFLQSWLRKKGRTFAIITTSLIFAGLHFSPSQADGNFILIPSLFLVSLFLGLVYEKEKNLLAPYLLHALFNLSHALMIII
ncbi:MAG: CPBP family intramembrane glutamic endopeptidase [Victivallaceae bacterium]